MVKSAMKWWQLLDRKELFQPNQQCQNVFQLNFDAILEKNANKVTSFSPLKIVIHKQEVKMLLLPGWQEVVPQLANKKTHY